MEPIDFARKAPIEQAQRTSTPLGRAQPGRQPSEQGSSITGQFRAILTAAGRAARWLPHESNVAPRLDSQSGQMQEQQPCSRSVIWPERLI